MDLHELKSRELLTFLGAKRHIIPFMPGRVLGMWRMYHGQGQGENSRSLNKFLIYVWADKINQNTEEKQPQSEPAHTHYFFLVTPHLVGMDAKCRRQAGALR